MKYGERLRLAREQAGLSQDELSALTNGEVKQGSISKIERGDQTRSSFDIDLAIALNIHPKWLKDEDERFKPDWYSSNLKSIRDYPQGSFKNNTKINEKDSTYLNDKELILINLFRRLALFQKIELIAKAEKMVEMAEMIRNEDKET